MEPVAGGERKPTRGRPSVGPVVEVQLPLDVLAAVEAQAERQKISRSALIRRIVESWVFRLP